MQHLVSVQCHHVTSLTSLVSEASSLTSDSGATPKPWSQNHSTTDPVDVHPGPAWSIVNVIGGAGAVLALFMSILISSLRGRVLGSRRPSTIAVRNVDPIARTIEPRPYAELDVHMLSISRT